MGVFVSLQNCFKEWAAGCEDYSVSLNLMVFLTHQSNIREVQLIPEVLVGSDYVLLEVIPLQTELLRGMGHIDAAVGH